MHERCKPCPGRLGLLATLTALAVISLVPTATWAQSAGMKAKADRMQQHVEYLASEDLQGRGVGYRGLEESANYIRDEFKRLGLKSGTKDGTYFQFLPVPISMEVDVAKTNLSFVGPKKEKPIEVKIGSGFQPLAIGGATNSPVKAPLVFAGYGITAPKQKYDDYKDLDVAGKVVLILRKEPQVNDKKSPFDGDKITIHATIRQKLLNAKKHKAAAVLLVNDLTTVKDAKEDLLTTPSGFGNRSMGIPFAHVSQKAVNELLKKSPLTVGDKKIKSLKDVVSAIDKNLKPISQPFSEWKAEYTASMTRKTVQTPNVVGVLEGEGPYANETIVIGGHYDHLGQGEIGSRTPDKKGEWHLGADDNASGTAAILEMARYFSKKGPQARRIVFIAFTAEERGLYGSTYYIKHPLFPLKDTVAMLNFDMIGRLDDKSKLVIYGTKTCKEFEALLDSLNETYKFAITNRPEGSGPSDHSVFYTKKVPVLHFFTGTHSDYHTPADTADLINADGMAKVTALAEDLTSKLLAMPTRPTYTVYKNPNPRRLPGGPRAYLGSIPDYTAEVKGVRLNGVAPGGPAAKAGIKAGDIITKIGEVDVNDIYGLTEALAKYKAGQTVDFNITRDKKKMTLKVKLGTRGG